MNKINKIENGSCYLFMSKFFSYNYAFLIGRMMPFIFFISAIHLALIIFIVIFQHNLISDELIFRFLILSISVLLFSMGLSLTQYKDLKPLIYSITLDNNTLKIQYLEFSKVYTFNIDLKITNFELVQDVGRPGITRALITSGLKKLVFKQNNKQIFEIRIFPGFFIGMTFKDILAIYDKLTELQKQNQVEQ